MLETLCRDEFAHETSYRAQLNVSMSVMASALAQHRLRSVRSGGRLPPFGPRLQLGDAHSRRNLFRVGAEFDQCRPARGERAIKRRCELLTTHNSLGMSPHRLRHNDEVGIDEVSADHAKRVRALLMHPDCAIHVVVEQQDDRLPPCCRAVEISCPLIENPPSPTQPITMRSG
jgi:hypothetical protein